MRRSCIQRELPIKKQMDEMENTLQKVIEDLQNTNTALDELKKNVDTCMETIRCFPIYGEEYKKTQESFAELTK